ncbi:alpha/beta hydrolase [Wocania ichthyoenteri]|uniref:alpha/beta hydrolase n=1 Tax=Wocania ichthyoenteri TaxID=1230531 RepID=UPI00053E7F25|nr:alpha/beta fold hydrolase [Wocania ichthyoenteri]
MLNTLQNPLKQKLKKGVLFLLSIYIMVGSLLYFLQEKMLFFPTVLEQDYVFKFSKPFEELFLKTDDKAVINAIHFKTENPKGVILYFHGNAGDLSRWGFIAEYFVEKQYDVLIMDYRTYGKSTGKLSEDVLYNDAQYCYDYLKERYKENEITLYGRSLGSGIAAYLASKNKPSQLILETPYYSITDVSQSRFPMFPVEKLLKYKLPSFQYIQQVKCPITMFHGTDDVVVPYKSAKKLFEVSPKDLVTFITIEGGNHGNLIDFEAYFITINKILP